jgi:apolipoprotein N-acyltransferase
MKRLKLLSLAILSGLLIGAAWFPPFTWVIFIAFVPLLILTSQIEKSNLKRKKLTIFILAYFSFLIWNCIDTWWIWYASDGGAVAAIVANSLLMALTYLLYISLNARIQNSKFKIQNWILIPIWLSFEYLHCKWELAWSWLTVGNIFAFEHNWVQWYEFTGVSGGTAWVLTVNILLYQLLQAKFKIQNSKFKMAITFAVIIIPILLSQLIIKFSNSQIDKLPAQQVLIVQPNIDPYNDKFNGDFEGQLQKVYNKIKNKVTAKTNYLELPETFLTEEIWENDIEKTYSIRFLKDSILAKFPDLNIVIGATTLRRYDKNEKMPATARAFTNTDIYYDVYNTAIQLNKEGIQLYHKSKLVPGVERMPYPAFFKPLEGLAIKLGGTFGSLGTQDERTVFFNRDKTVGIAPVVCYESVFGEYVTNYINNGANIIFIITNDGWWRDTPGYKQHLAYARLRAIETRKQIARSANTGVSCVVDELGEIHAEQAWWKEGYIMANINPNSKLTFYVKFGDVLSKVASVLTFMLIGYSIFLRFKKR